MATQLSSYAEQCAVKAEEFKAFSGFKLLHIKQELEIILSQIGRAGIFDQYTLHDISHVDAMLELLEWLVPERTKEIMTPADWLLVVLAICFHDLGMLVTEKEYQARNGSGFQNFVKNDLFGGSIGKDYEAKVFEAYPDQDKRERFLYQEFVRNNHAKRIRAWITTDAFSELGIAEEVIQALRQLLNNLDEVFRRDLALVCESHHLNDLENSSKYPVSQPYGNKDEETANVQYAAILLRTADLLHVTRDRTPSIAFRIINPSDPVSQQEWVKQMAVRTVRAQKKRDKEGKVDKNAEKDTIEVHARFTDANGFFGLTSYLAYADQQLKKNYEWADKSAKAEGSQHLFPWKNIDDSNVEASGFLRQPFSFEIDQAKILDLLTGHTLYNNTGVVLRELVQNALDTVRLQALITTQTGEKKYRGNVNIK